MMWLDGYVDGCPPGGVDFLLVSSMFGPLWHKCDAKVLIVVMEMQFIMPENGTLQQYMKSESDPGFQLVICHLSDWGYSMFRRTYNYRNTPFMHKDWIKHDTKFRNAVDGELIHKADAKSLVRSNKSLI